MDFRVSGNNGNVECALNRDELYKHFGKDFFLRFFYLVILTHTGGNNRYECHSLLLHNKRILSQNISTVTLFFRACKPLEKSDDRSLTRI